MRLRGLAVTGLGALWWHLLRFRRREALTAIREVFPDVSPAEVLPRSVGSAAFGYIELALGADLVWEGLEPLRAGGLVLTYHGGPWDLALVAAARRLPVTIFVRTPTSPLAATLVRHLRTRGADLELLPPRGSFADGLAALRAGRVVACVEDQRWPPGVVVPFLGRPALSSTGFARLALASDAPLFAARQWRDLEGVPHGQVEPVDPPDRSLEGLTRWSQEWIGASVRARPQDWWWLHRRWRLD
jgi:KDO2-lipid IV(A) lauroyltransferase